MNNKKYLVYGMARSGLATANYLTNHGYETYICDDKDLLTRDDLPNGAKIITDFSNIPLDIDGVILAPAIPLTHPAPHKIVKWAKDNNIEILCDIELFYRIYAHNPNVKFIAITGTNGKSTVTALTTHLLDKMGKTAYACGNIGTAIFSVKMPEDHAAGQDILYVIEVSSYQADLCHDFAPNSVCLLNLTTDHIDRHGSMEGYFNAKMRLFNHLSNYKKAVLLGNDDYVTKARNDCKYNFTPSDTQKLSVRDAIKTNKFLCGEHNYENALNAFCLIASLGFNDADILPNFASFIGLPHRLEFISTKHNITFINDSKATNAESAQKAITTFENIYWIMGGIAKADGIEPLLNDLEWVNHVFIYGQDQKIFANSLRKTHKEFSIYHTLEEAFYGAVQMALEDTEPAVVLLSPAAASFDAFKSFEHRGDVFRELVKNFS